MIALENIPQSWRGTSGTAFSVPWQRRPVAVLLVDRDGNARRTSRDHKAHALPDSINVPETTELEGPRWVEESAELRRPRPSFGIRCFGRAEWLDAFTCLYRESKVRPPPPPKEFTGTMRLEFEARL